jgi:hypothetical protein
MNTVDLHQICIMVFRIQHSPFSRWVILDARGYPWQWKLSSCFGLIADEKRSAFYLHYQFIFPINQFIPSVRTKIQNCHKNIAVTDTKLGDRLSV